MIGRIAVAAVVLGGLASPPIARADTLSPIFGNASVTPTTVAQNKSIVGKGYYADVFASYGIDYASAAIAYGQFGDYGSAAAYANAAYQNFDIAAYYQAIGL